MGALSVWASTACASSTAKHSALASLCPIPAIFFSIILFLIIIVVFFFILSEDVFPLALLLHESSGGRCVERGWREEGVDTEHLRLRLHGIALCCFIWIAFSAVITGSQRVPNGYLGRYRCAQTNQRHKWETVGASTSPRVHKLASRYSSHRNFCQAMYAFRVHPY